MAGKLSCGPRHKDPSGQPRRFEARQAVSHPASCGAERRGSCRLPEPSWCPHCYRSLWMGTRCKRRTCPGYVETYLRDWATVISAALAEWDGLTTIATLTAPGASELPWDPRLCRIKGPHKHSGPAGCQVNPMVAAGWNHDLNRRFSRLLNAGREDVRRSCLPRPVLLLAVCELKRGVFHLHVVFGYYPYQRAGLDQLLKYLRRHRGEYGFGRGRKGFDPGSPGKYTGEHAGRYASKYLRPDGAKGSFLPALEVLERVVPRDPETGRPRHLFRPVYVSPLLTRKSGITISWLRFVRYAYARWGPGLSPHELRLLHEFVRVFERGAAEPVGEGVPALLAEPPPLPPSPEWVAPRLF